MNVIPSPGSNQKPLPGHVCRSIQIRSIDSNHLKRLGKKNRYEDSAHHSKDGFKDGFTGRTPSRSALGMQALGALKVER
ncbi:hypothetical protein [Reticulibacter mediterranei]|uniref:hypothetical protein n=1 Tax=Reticulibacter mediterranei TaxID=2778369 RepID=UPI001C68BDEC|nr:hypothetical protein [Reticulibacter mediterranei]